MNKLRSTDRERYREKRERGRERWTNLDRERGGMEGRRDKQT